MIELLVLGGLALGAIGLGRAQRRHIIHQHERFLASLTEEAQIVLHVANHEAVTRRQSFTIAHLAYGMLQDEAFTAAMKQLGGEPDELETLILSSLDKGVPVSPRRDGRIPEAVIVIAHAAATAQSLDRKATLADLYGHLIRTSGRALFEHEKFSATELLFVLVHGSPPPPPELPGARDVMVVLRNDDFTTRELVVRILIDEFGLGANEAHRIMETTDESGYCVVGRFAGEVARTKIEAARTRALLQGAPLWIGVEPA